eukprot:TRINITY_DN5072_c0_g1_i1.p1 TRINITY_DN5072_c0_g1~~TRINITY_DN5072_c0_g1_i1.p1  ORF type:complete len:299 (+),score=77.01 TRINITY_DN5072_c0_g1_i1:51-947(+)
MLSKSILIQKGAFSAIRSFANIIREKVKVNGVDLHYTKAGEGDDVLLLMPGAMGCAETDFMPQIEGLSTKHTVIAIDPRGQGNSRPPKREYPKNFFNIDAEDALGLMDALDIEKAILLGWSDGANSASILAGSEPSRIRGLAIWGGNSYVDEDDLELYEKVEDVSQWSESMRSKMVDMYGLEETQRMWSEWIEAMKQISEEEDGDICLEELHNIDCPTLVIHGKKDPMVPQVHAHTFTAMIAKSFLYFFEEAKHNPHIRYAADFNQLITNFVLSVNKFEEGSCSTEGGCSGCSQNCGS